ncbi:type III-A CRISPR-associated protein Csm2 [Candidatus Hakubella thermalkaliphila]|uniref:CRISPR system Cms protein Csm2 n=1 Tax=Candidatus Hakubella thermalkaliphila TaxID=2754717 RepID=A0A6V8QE60_9ACTN|nr:type III-A CRISPR-associated protein Csm2 [Candidatus Hakubella thermalkaliphila]GFP27976.1 hypothetical protein HKBW3S33_01393 [Candidatus Hakubella thermalkaliphila]GFP43042.1 hypothetical protein HKBW3C_02174 [Candidatus Hakubella thermalkaliphila]
MSEIDAMVEKIKKRGFLDNEVLKDSEMFANNFKTISNSKMRQYFDVVKNIGNLIEMNPKVESIIVKLHILRSKIYYDAKRDQKIEVFRYFISKVIDFLNEGRDLSKVKDFTIYFENLYGYFYAVSSGR